MRVSRAGVAPSLWSTRQRLVLVVLLALAVTGLTAGYVGTSGTLQVSRQVVWINVAGAALLVSGAGIALFLATGRRAIGRRRLTLIGDVPEEGGLAGKALEAASGDLLATATMTRYHRADCSFVAGKPGVLVATVAGHRQAGRRPCGVCSPGGES